MRLAERCAWAHLCGRKPLSFSCAHMLSPQCSATLCVLLPAALICRCRYHRNALEDSKQAMPVHKCARFVVRCLQAITQSTS